MRPLLVTLALLLATVTPVMATPVDFDFGGGTYTWQWGEGPQTAAVLMLSSHGIADWMLLFPADSGLGGLIEFRPVGDQRPGLPPFQPGLVDQRLHWAMDAHILGTQQGEGPFSGWQFTRVRFRPVNGEWALDQPDLAHTPEPLSLLLMGGTLAVAGWVARKRRGR